MEIKKSRTTLKLQRLSYKLELKKSFEILPVPLSLATKRSFNGLFFLGIFVFAFVSKVDSKDAFWGWIEESFIPEVYDTTWYNDQSFVASEGFLSTREAFLVGMPRFKQTRIKEGKF